MPPRVLFRTDAARLWGLSFGHAFRCLAIARYLTERGMAECHFLMRDFPDGVAVVRQAGFAVRTIAAAAPMIEECTALGSCLEDVIVIDLPPGRRPPLDGLAAPALVIADDDPAPGGGRTIVGTVVAEPEPGPRRYAGTSYCVIAPEFVARRRTVTRARVEKILVTFGGSDPAGLTLKTTAALSAMPLAARVEVVMGPGFADADQLSAIAQRAVGSIRLSPPVDDLALKMVDADLCIAAAGRTAYELAATGTPAILVPSIDHEEAIAAALMRAGCAHDLGRWSDHAPAALDQALGRLGGAPCREEMRQKGLALFDGRGCERIAGIIAEAAA